MEKLNSETLKPALQFSHHPSRFRQLFQKLTYPVHLFRTFTGDSLNLKLFTGWFILPFSMRKTPSLVRPVSRICFRSTVLIYHNLVTYMPFSVEAIRSSTDLLSSFHYDIGRIRNIFAVGFFSPVSVSI